jgi:hypothetical protein
MRVKVDTDPGYALAATILQELEPRELPALPAVWKAYARRPVRPVELPGKDHLIGGGLADQVIGWAPLVVAFLCTEVLRAAAVDEAKDGLRRGVRGLLGRLRRREYEPTLVPPEFDDTEIERIRHKALETALALGEEPARATLFADAVVGGLSRRGPVIGG